MAIGRFVSDLDRGDVLGPVEYALSPFVVREYCHAVELHQEYFQGSVDQIAPPTMIHLEKLRLYRFACPAGTGPDARVQRVERTPDGESVFHLEVWCETESRDKLTVGEAVVHSRVR